MNENLSNGVPTRSGPPSERYAFNGIGGSATSSRDSSPGARLQQIPLSHLPPIKPEIPASQLPPSRANLGGITATMNRISISPSPHVPTMTKGSDATSKSAESTVKSVETMAKGIETPFASPVVGINTSTPIQDREDCPRTSVPNLKEDAFVHSSTSHFAAVKSGGGSGDTRDDKKTIPYFQEANQNVKELSQTGTISNQSNFPRYVNPVSLQSQQQIDNSRFTQGYVRPSQSQDGLSKNVQGGTVQRSFQPPISQQQSLPDNLLQQSNLRTQSNSYQMQSQQNQGQSQSGLGIGQGQGLQKSLQQQNQTLLQNSQQILVSQQNKDFQQPNQGLSHNFQQSQGLSQQNKVLQQNLPLLSQGQRLPQNLPTGSPQSLQQSRLPQPGTQHNQPYQQNQSNPTGGQRQNPPTTSNVPPYQPQEQNKAHLHSNRYPQRPNASNQMYGQHNFQNNQQQGLQATQQNYQHNQTVHPQQNNQQNLVNNQQSLATQQNYTKTQQNYPSSQQNYPSNQQNYPSTQQNYPSTQQNYPSTQQNYPSTQQNYPSNQQNYPSTQQNYPSTQQNYLNAQQNFPNTQQSFQGNQVYQNTQNQNNFQGYRPTVAQQGFNKLWGAENYDLLQTPNILPPARIDPPRVNLGQDFLDAINCSPSIFRCTMTKIPETAALLQKSRLPLGVLIHPFKDLNHLPVIQCNTIVRCRTCRTYINPYVFFVDSKRWKCNLCYRVNELPEEFQYDPVSKTYGDPSRRPEVKASTIEYIAPAEYMLRPPQPAVYLYLLDVSRLAIETGYLRTVCEVLGTEIANVPGDARTQIGFLAYDSALHFYSLADGQNQPHEMTVLDVDDVFIPCPDNLLVNLQDRIDLINDLLTQLPNRFTDTHDSGSALGAALQAAYKLTAATGGRVTVFQAALPNKGPGALTPREDPNQRSSAEVHHLNPANDFYKRLALECSGQQVAVDLFILNSQYVDLATISGISRFSGGCLYHYPLFKSSRPVQNDGFERSLRRYVTRKIGFEAVMRIRTTRGLGIHTFHGNFFVRSTDLLSLPNINPDAGFGMQVSIDESLADVQTVCFQAALLYTSSKGERRIRVHTLCLPVANTVQDVINSADQQCIVGLLAKMAVDRSMQSSLSDAREAFLNVAIDILSSYKLSLNMGTGMSGLMAPDCLKLLPLYISALLKSVAFRVGTSTRLDDRIRAMCDMKTKPLRYLIQQIYPDLYPVHNLEEHRTVLNEEEEQVHVPPHLQLSARNLDSNGAYLLDTGEHMIIFVCSNVSHAFVQEVFDVNDYNCLMDDAELPSLDNPRNRRLNMFVNYLNEDKPYQATLQVIKENSPCRVVFLERLIEDRMENSLSYHEFLQHVKSQIK